MTNNCRQTKHGCPSVKGSQMSARLHQWPKTYSDSDLDLNIRNQATKIVSKKKRMTGITQYSIKTMVSQLNKSTSQHFARWSGIFLMSDGLWKPFPTSQFNLKTTLLEVISLFSGA